MTILHALERGPRGVYAGAFGYVGVDGALDLAMVIRSHRARRPAERTHRRRRRHHGALGAAEEIAEGGSRRAALLARCSGARCSHARTE